MNRRDLYLAEDVSNWLASRKTGRHVTVTTAEEG